MGSSIAVFIYFFGRQRMPGRGQASLMMSHRQEALVFRSDIRPLLKLSVIIALMGPFIFFVILVLRTKPEYQGFNQESLLVVAGPSVIGVMIAAIALVSRHRSIVVVSPEGLQGYDRYGRDHFIAWNDILSVSPFEPDFGLRYLRIAVPLREEYVTLPLFLENMPKFVQAVEKFAGRDSALARALRGENLHDPAARQAYDQHMASAREYLRNWMRWQRGRQGTGYDKMLLLANPLLIPFDLYLLRFPEGTEIPPHRDPVTGRRHFRLNIILRRPRTGGEFVCEAPIFETRRIKLFRSDVSLHSVTRVQGGTRYVLSLGWVLK